MSCRSTLATTREACGDLRPATKPIHLSIKMMYISKDDAPMGLTVQEHHRHPIWEARIRGIHGANMEQESPNNSCNKVTKPRIRLLRSVHRSCRTVQIPNRNTHERIHRSCTLEPRWRKAPPVPSPPGLFLAVLRKHQEEGLWQWEP
jgi:hypothetical protein